MSSYGLAAVEAATICGGSQKPDPVTAWQTAVQKFCHTHEGQKKGCPKGAFLGLCEEGLVAGVPRGDYTRSRLNKDYALRAVRLIQQDHSLACDAKALWQTVMTGAAKGRNGQMDVVIALWEAGLLKMEA